MISQEKGFEIGIYTLGDVGPDPVSGKTITPQQRLKEVIEMAKLSEEAGLDVFGVGEHHRLDYSVSSPAVVLAAAAASTKKIKLVSTTSVLSTLDPVRLFEDFATLDILSDGRAEIMAGRGAFIESFPLFGYDLDDYDELFEENLSLLTKLNKEEIVTWSGKFRPALRNAMIAPRPVQEELPIWVGVGGTPSSAARAGRFGAGLALAILGGPPERFKPLVDMYRSTALKSGVAEDDLRVAVNGHTFIAETNERAKDEFFPYYSNYWQYVNAQRGMKTYMSREDFDRMAVPGNALFVGSPEQITEKILHQHELFGHHRFLAQIDIGGIPFSRVAKTIELLATKVAPVVRRELNKKKTVKSTV